MTQDTQIVLPFARLCGKTLQADFNGGTLTSDGGVLLLRETETHVGVMRRVVEALDDRRDRRSIDHSYEELLRQRIFQSDVGSGDANDCNPLRRDPAFKAACNRRPIVGEDLAILSHYKTSQSKGEGFIKEVTVGIVMQSKSQRNDDRQIRWDRLARAGRFEQYRELRARGISQRQAAQQLEVPRTTLQAWQVYQERLDAEPAVVAFFQSPPGLAFLHRLVVGLHLVCTEVGAGGIRLVCLLLKLTGLERFVSSSYATQQQVNRQVEEAIVAYRQEESTRLVKDMPAKAITVAQDETFTGGALPGGDGPRQQ